MTLTINPGDISCEDSMETLQNIIQSRLKDVDGFTISLENTSKINLASFNQIVRLYMKLKRMNKSLVFNHCSDMKLLNLISKTKLTHVFSV